MGVRSVVSHRRPVIFSLWAVLLLLLVARDASATSPVLWGIGDTFAGAQGSPLMVDTDLRMVTHWYNGPGDLGYIRQYVDNDTVNEWYADGFAIQLIIHLAGGQIDYALSPQFLTDLGELVRIFKGNGPNYGPLYVVMFTEFSVWPENLRNSPTAAAQTQYAKTIPVVHSNYKKGYVGLGFTGNSWQAGNPIAIETNWGPSIRASDFVGCQQMQDFRDVDLLIRQVNASISQLGSYGLPVMVSHFKMWQNPGTGTADELALAMDDFLEAVFDEGNFDFLRSQGLFAWGWMDDHYINDEHPFSYPALVDFLNEHNQTSLYPINEAEYTTVKSSSVATQIATGALASAGKLVVMNSTALNQSLVFSAPVTKTGTYRIFIRFKKQASRGYVKLYVADWIQGAEQNLYSAADAYVTVDMGTKTFNATGLKDFKFVVSRVGAGGGYTMAVDSIQLIPE